MKTDLSTTFLHKSADENPPPPLVSAPRRTIRMHWLIASGIGVAVVAYLILMGSALWEQFRSPISPMKDGWFRVRDRERKFQVDFPKSPSKRSSGSQIMYEAHLGMACSVLVRADSRAKQLLKNSASSVLRTSMQADAKQGRVTLLDNKVVDSKTQWIEYQVMYPEGMVMRRRLILHDTLLVELTVMGAEVDVMSPDATRILTSVVWFGR